MIKKRQAKHVRSYLETSILRRRRRRKRIMTRVFFLILLGGIISGAVYVLHTPTFQVDAVEVTGTSQISPSDIQTKTMDEIAISRNLFGLVPPTNILFVDEKDLEKAITNHFPAIESVIVQTGLGGKVKVTVSERVAIAIWCDSFNTACYQMDESGYVFLPLDTTEATSSPNADDKIIFKGILDERNQSQIGQRYLSQKEISVFVDARTNLGNAGKNVDYVRCDSDILCVIKISNNGVLKVNPNDDLVNAFDRLSSALKSPALAKEKFEYVDLRYGNKLFYKLGNGNQTVSISTSSAITTTQASTTIATSTLVQ